MCGIIFVHKKDSSRANKAVLKRYKNQKSRGDEGFGYISINKNKLVDYRRASLESQIEKVIKNDESQTILFHHRYPTSTPNLKESAHPIKVSNIKLKYDYYVVHNGIINNADDLKEKHEEMGFEYNTELVKKYVTSGSVYKETMFNDSESLAVELALAIDKKTNKIEATGSIAFIVVKVNKTSNNIVGIYYGRNIGSPLKVCSNEKFFCLGSETEGEIVPSHILFKFDLKTNTVKEERLSMPEYRVYGYDTSHYGGYASHYQTTFGYDDDDDDYDKLPNIEMEEENEYDNKFFTQLQDRWNKLDDEILSTETYLDYLNENDDGSPESENSIIDAEALLNSLYDEKTKLDGALTRMAFENDEKDLDK